MSNISDINPSKSVKNVKKSSKKEESHSSAKKKELREAHLSENKDSILISKSGQKDKPTKRESQKIREWTHKAMSLKDDPSRVEQAKDRLQSGFYNDPAVLRTVVEKISEDLFDK